MGAADARNRCDFAKVLLSMCQPNPKELTCRLDRRHISCRDLLVDKVSKMNDPWAETHANQAIRRHGFQTLANPVIPLDLTGIIAFDALCEWACSTRVDQ